MAAAGSTLFGASAVAALAVLDLHTSDEPLPTGGSSATTEPATTPQRKGCGCAPRWLIWTLLLAIGGFALVSGACLDACTGSNLIRYVPAIHGRVVDMETGQPLAGVRITRWFERVRMAGLGGAEHYSLERSFRTAVTDDNGRFHFPAWHGIVRGVAEVRWFEFKPGWTAGRGTLLTSDPTGFHVARANLNRYSVLAENRGQRSAISTTFRLRRVDNPDTAEDHFWALVTLFRDGHIPASEFATEAAAYAEKNGLTAGMLLPVSSLTDSIRQPAYCDLTAERHALLHAVTMFCTSHSEVPQCQWPIVWNAVHELRPDSKSQQRQEE